MTTLSVGAGDTRYDVVVGPFASEAPRVLAIGERPILISEPRVFALHGAAVAEQIGARDPILLPEGEAAKQWPVLHDLLGQLATRNASRATPIVALGGGSVGDCAGLAASLFKRGCPVVHLPTTLLAQADSAVGGKTAIDAFGEKNVIGTFHQPALVIADPAWLDTLDARQLRSGYAEIVKYGLIDDPAHFAWCEANGRALIAGHRDAREAAVVASIQAKARLVEGDLDDRRGRRALLNLGHSFAHAIESAAGFGHWLHGEAVAVGLGIAFRVSTALGECSAADAERVGDHLSAVGLPRRLADVSLSPEALRPWMLRDKKNVGEGLTLVLAHAIGRAFVRRVPADTLFSILAAVG